LNSVRICPQAAAMGWMHKTEIKEYEMDSIKSPQDNNEKYHRTDTTYSPNETDHDLRISSPTTNSVISENL